MDIEQTDRLIRIDTPLGQNTFVVMSFFGTEQISDLFSFELELISECRDISFDQLAGQNIQYRITFSLTKGPDKCLLRTRCMSSCLSL